MRILEENNMKNSFFKILKCLLVALVFCSFNTPVLANENHININDYTYEIIGDNVLKDVDMQVQSMSGNIKIKISGEMP